MNIVHNKDIASLPVYVVVFSSFVFDMWWDKTEGLKKTIFAKVHVYMYIEVKRLAFYSGCIPLIYEIPPLPLNSSHFPPSAFYIKCFKEKRVHMLVFIKGKINRLNMDLNN